ncbi:MAG: glycosyltransferase family 39 protein [Nitrospirae bacterium]|nr:glycosyltransferase family 39 protein [Nitrospirota bacterium]
MMKEIRKFPLSYAILIVALMTYSVLIVTSYHYERLTGDATLYLSIAEKYLRGDFSNAVNGYWGPLLSWLLVPFLYLGASHIFAVNALNLIFGVLTMIGIWRLSLRFEISENIRIIILLPLVPIFVFISLIEPMDFLLLCVLVYYLGIVFNKDYPGRLINAVLCGVLGALAYFSKPYGFPFFIAHFSLFNAGHYFRSTTKEHRKNVLRNALAGFVIFSLLSGVWIALISNKYGHLTFSNMGRGVFASLGPESEHGTLEKGDPIFFEGFFEPPNETAFVIYEDPSYARKKTWSPLESRSSLLHFIENLSENFFEGLRIYESYSRLSIAIVIVYILLIAYQPPNKLISRGDLLYPLLTVILYTGGYFPFHFETRYLWIVNILLLLMGGKVLHILFQNEFFKKNILRNILTAFFVLSFIVTPVKSSIEIDENNLNRKMHELGVELSSRYDIKGNIASNRQKVHTSIHDSWHQTFRLSYWLKCRYYGQARENISEGDLENELKGYDIDYYFFWGDPSTMPLFLSQHKELTGGEIPGLKIYSLKERKQL